MRPLTKEEKKALKVLKRIGGMHSAAALGISEVILAGLSSLGLLSAMAGPPPYYSLTDMGRRYA